METTILTPLERWEESGRDIELGLAILADAGSKTLTPHIINRLRRESPDAYLIGKLQYALWKLKPQTDVPETDFDEKVPAQQFKVKSVGPEAGKAKPQTVPVGGENTNTINTTSDSAPKKKNQVKM